jgi:ABC-type phosphate transport system ATPase subunit
MSQIPEIVVAVMGVTGSGKSTFIRTASELKDEVEVGTGLEACRSPHLNPPVIFV